jgi:xanthine/uracil/vitamin C permease (AzgA family)
MALGMITYPIVKGLSGRLPEVKWLMYVLAAILLLYFILVRVPWGSEGASE